jgi:hypothetical protein
LVRGKLRLVALVVVEAGEALSIDYGNNYYSPTVSF